MENATEFQMEEGGFLPFDPIVLVQDVMKRWLLIVLAALVVGIGSYIMTDMQYRPVYQTNATFVVTTRGSSASVYSNLTSTTSLVSVFEELLNSSLLRKTILTEIGQSSFNGTITASAVAETNLMTLRVTASDPRTAFLVAQAIIDHHEIVTYEVVDNVVLEVLQKPVVPMGTTNSADAAGRMEKMMLLTAAVAFLGLAWLSFSRDTVRSGKEAGKKLDCWYMGEIPHENKHKTLLSRLRRKKSSILITNPTTSFRYVETIHKLRRRVEQHMDGGKVIMVTSLLENEGKSTVAVNLALAMAKKHERVLLIDCDLRKPACYAIFGQKMAVPGVRDVLTGKARISDAIVRYKKTNLYLMLENKADANSGDRLSSDRMRTLLELAKKEFDFIILDLPPMSVVSDAESVMDIADASLMVVRQNVAVAPALNKAISSLQSGKAKMLGCVLNNVYATALSSGQGYGGYGSYGKYGHYGSYGAASGRTREQGR